MVIDDSVVEAQANVNTDDETVAAEIVVSSKSNQDEQIPVVDEINDTTEETEEEDIQVAEEVVRCNDTGEVIDDEMNIIEEDIDVDVAEEVTEKTAVVSSDEVKDDSIETTENN